VFLLNEIFVFELKQKLVVLLAKMLIFLRSEILVAETIVFLLTEMLAFLRGNVGIATDGNVVSLAGRNVSPPPLGTCQEGGGRAPRPPPLRTPLLGSTRGGELKTTGLFHIFHCLEYSKRTTLVAARRSIYVSANRQKTSNSANS